MFTDIKMRTLCKHADNVEWKEDMGIWFLMKLHAALVGK